MYTLPVESIKLLKTDSYTVCSPKTHTQHPMQSISAVVSELLPSAPQALSSALLVGGQSFTDSTFYVPYLPYAPQQALGNIFTVVRRLDKHITCSLYESIGVTLINSGLP